MSTILKDYIHAQLQKADTINWLLFVMYQFSPFSSVPSMTNLRTGKPVLTNTRDRRTLAHNGQILIERNFSFIKSLK